MTSSMANERGEASAFIAAGVGLSLLLLLFFGALTLLEAYRTQRILERAVHGALLWSEIDGGLSARAQGAITTILAQEGLDPGAATLAGTPEGVSWGGPIEIRVDYPFTFRWVTGGWHGLRWTDRRVILSARAAATSAWVPLAGSGP